VIYLGGTGTDTLIGPDTGRTWHITGTRAGDIAGGGFTFSAVENLTAGADAGDT
jgi:hypothetical protein